MTKRRFVPFSKRQDVQEEAAYLDSLHEGIPEHLRSTVASFLFGMLEDQSGVMTGQMSGAKLLQVERDLQVALQMGAGPTQAAQGLVKRAFAEPEFGLDLIDQQLVRNGGVETEMVAALDSALTEGGSAYRVVRVDRDSWPHEYRLEHRVAPTVAEAGSQAMEGGRSGEHLRSAWSAIYGRSSDPGKAYRESVKAVEVAAGRVVIPTDDLATLGKVIGALKAKPNMFRVAIQGAGDGRGGERGDVDAVTIVRLMAQLLWTGQHDRHGTVDEAKPLDVSIEEATAAVHLAVLLTHWFESGVVTRST